ncbi:MAG TPA: hypothetical protein VIC87_08990 [Vicinamibacteria bacterium]|jgi:hypothetical protein
MRFACLLLLAAPILAQPPRSPSIRMRDLREKIAVRAAQAQEREEYEKKPREEKIFISFKKGEEKFETRLTLKAKTVVELCLVKWTDVQQAAPTPAAVRVLGEFPAVISQPFGGLDVNKKERYEVADLLVELLDSEFLHVRVAAFESLKAIYRTQSGHFYEPTMTKKERAEPIKSWEKFVRKSLK